MHSPLHPRTKHAEQTGSISWYVSAVCKSCVTWPGCAANAPGFLLRGVSIKRKLSAKARTLSIALVALLTSPQDPTHIEPLGIRFALPASLSIIETAIARCFSASSRCLEISFIATTLCWLECGAALVQVIDQIGQEFPLHTKACIPDFFRQGQGHSQVLSVDRAIVSAAICKLF